MLGRATRAAKFSSLPFMASRRSAGLSTLLEPDYKLRKRLRANFDKLKKLCEAGNIRGDKVVISDFLAAREEDQKIIYIEDHHAAELVGMLKYCGIPCELETLATEPFGQGSETVIRFDFKPGAYGGMLSVLTRLKIDKASKEYASSLPSPKESEDEGLVIE